MSVTETFAEAWKRLERDIDATRPVPLDVGGFKVVVTPGMPSNVIAFRNADGSIAGKIINLDDHRG